MRSKVLILILLCAVLLCGCGKPYKVTEKPTKRHEYVPPAPKFELEPEHVAKLFNNSLAKAILRSETGDSLTVVMPRFYTGHYGQDHSSIKTDFHYTLVPPGTYYNEDGELTVSHIVYTIDFVREDEVQNYDTNLLRFNLKDQVLSEDEYPADSYESYEDYFNAYMDSVDSLFSATSESVSTLKLVGELEPITGRRLSDHMQVGEETYDLPYITYRFQLSSGNYIYVRAHLLSPDSNKVLSVEELSRLFILPKKEPKAKELRVLTDYLTNLEFEYEDVLDTVISGLIYGDYSSYWKPVKDSRSTSVSGNSDATAFVDELDSNENTDKDTEDKNDSTGTKDTKSTKDKGVKDTKDKSNKSTKDKEPVESFSTAVPEKKSLNTNSGVKVINEVSDSTQDEGYEDYDPSGGEYYFEE